MKSDSGGKYYGRYEGSDDEQCSWSFAEYFVECGIVPQYTVLGNPHQNDVPEQQNQTLKDIVRSLFFFTRIFIR